MTNILEKIVSTKKAEVDKLLTTYGLDALKSRALDAPHPRNFLGELSKPGNRIIAEIKKASPSAGVLRNPFLPGEIARSYSTHGAACLSVLTDVDYFQGCLKFLEEVRAAVSLPALRKDFLIHPSQVYEARAHGADAILLIAEILEKEELQELHGLAESLNMAVLVELHDQTSVEKVLSAQPRLVGINNRDLRTFETRLEQSLELAPLFPPSTIIVSESGIKTPADIKKLNEGGINRFLVGESFMRAGCPGEKLAELIR